MMLLVIFVMAQRVSSLYISIIKTKKKSFTKLVLFITIYRVLEKRLGKAESIVAYPTDELINLSPETDGQVSVTYHANPVEQDSEFKLFFVLCSNPCK